MIRSFHTGRPASKFLLGIHEQLELSQVRANAPIDQNSMVLGVSRSHYLPLTVFTRIVAPSIGRTLNLSLVVWYQVVLKQCIGCTPTFGVEFWGKKMHLMHGWIR